MVRCDNCGKEAEGDGAIHWYRVESMDPEYARMGEPEGPLHFHSWWCMAFFASSMSKRLEPAMDRPVG